MIQKKQIFLRSTVMYFWRLNILCIVYIQMMKITRSIDVQNPQHLKMNIKYNDFLFLHTCNLLFFSNILHTFLQVS